MNYEYKQNKKETLEKLELTLTVVEPQHIIIGSQRMILFHSV